MLSPRYIDTREAPERRVPLERGGFMPRALSYGDVQFPAQGGGTVLVENKKVVQLLEDMSSGQLVRQIRGLVENADWPLLLVEGPWRQQGGKLLDHNYSWEQAWNQMQTLQDMGCRLQLSTSPEHTVQRIFELADYYAKDFHPSALRRPAGDLRAAALSLIPGIGAKYASTLMEHFGSLGALAQATQEQLEAVDGVGPVLARRVLNFWKTGAL